MDYSKCPAQLQDEDENNRQADIPSTAEHLDDFLPIAEMLSTGLIKQWIDRK
jgi:hypothetical protein